MSTPALPTRQPNDPEATAARSEDMDPADYDADRSRALFAELDELLERMMALPVSESGEDERSGNEGPSRFLEVPLITIAEAAPAPLLPYSAPLPPVSYVEESLAPAPMPEFHAEPESIGPLPSFRMPESVPLAPIAPARAEPESIYPLYAKRRVPTYAVWEMPLVWFNLGYDGLTWPLGRPGRWMRSRVSRFLLGWIGLALLFATCGLALHDWIGWNW